jgi:hypothetical protein
MAGSESQEGRRVDEDRGSAAPGGPPPPPEAVPPGGPAPAPPPPPGAHPAPPASRPGWGDPGPAPSAWSAPTGEPGAWGAASPDAQVNWGRPQPGSSNGCLKGCLIVGGVLAVLAVIAVVGLVIAGGRLMQQIQEDPDSVFGGECPYVSPFDVGEAIGTDVQVYELAGLADGTMGNLLDKRLLRDAPDCWIIGEDGTTGRIAVLDGGGEAAFDAAAAEAQHFRGADAEIGDEAFCTTTDTQGFGGVLVRFGDRVAYVSMLDQSLDEERACAIATSVAETLAP